jgi:protein deglycase
MDIFLKSIYKGLKQMAHVITILADGFEEIEAVTYIDLLRRAQVNVSVLGLETQTVRGAHDLMIHTDGLLKDFADIYDGIILPGGQPGTANLAESPLVIKKVQDSFSSGLLCAAICAAPSVFAKAGILKGKKATCYPSVTNELTDATYIELPVVHDKNVITSRGAGTAIDFSLELIRYLANNAMAEKIRVAILAA